MLDSGKQSFVMNDFSTAGLLFHLSIDMRQQRRVQELISGLLPLVIGAELLFWIIVLPQSLHGYADFRQLYASGYMLRHGMASKLYNYNTQLQIQNEVAAGTRIAMPFLRPAYQAIVFVPLSLLSYKSAYLIWLGINVFLACLGYQLISDFLPAFQWKALPVLAFLSFAPLSIGLIQGQDSVLWFLLFALALRFVRRGHESQAGMLMALGLFKFQLAIPIALLFVIWRRRSFLKGFIPTAIALAMISVAIVGHPGILDLLHRRFVSPTGGIAVNVDYRMMANVNALFIGVLGYRTWARIAGVVASGAVLVAGGLKMRKRDLLNAGILAALGSYYLYPHDWLLLIVPVLYWIGVGGWQSWTAGVTFLAAGAELLMWQQAFWFTLPMVAIGMISFISPNFALADLRTPAETNGPHSRTRTGQGSALKEET